MEEKSQIEAPIQTDKQVRREKRLVDLDEYQIYFCKKEEVSEKQLKITFELRPEVKILGKIKGVKGRGKLNASKIELIADSPTLSEMGSLKMIFGEVTELTYQTRPYLVAIHSDITKLREDYEGLKTRIENAYDKRKPLKLKLKYLEEEEAKD